VTLGGVSSLSPFPTLATPPYSGFAGLLHARLRGAQEEMRRPMGKWPSFTRTITTNERLSRSPPAKEAKEGTTKHLGHSPLPCVGLPISLLCQGRKALFAGDPYQR